MKFGGVSLADLQPSTANATQTCSDTYVMDE